MPIGTPHGTLDYKQVSKVTFVGASSNTVIDTTTGSLGVGVDSGGPTSNLHVVGNTRLEGDINMLHTSNTASIKLNSNVVAEFPRSKKLIKYPRVALTSAAQTGSGYEGYIATASSSWSNSINYDAWAAFNGNIEEGTQEGWVSISGSYDNATPSLPATSGINAVLFNSRYGDWLNIKLPHKIVLSKLHTYPRTGNENPGVVRPNEHPDAGYLYGSNDGFDSFQEIYSFDGVPVSTTFRVPTIHTVNATKAYNEYRFQVTKLKGQKTATTISEMELFGVPEYDPDAHGTDVTVKSYPNVPNTDWLEVYYDAKNYSGSGDVQDETTNNRDAEMNATFDNGEIKAFNFSGAYTSNVTTSDHGLGTGDVTYTMSYWFKRTAVAGSYDYVVMLGNGGVNKSSALMWINNNQLTLDHWGAALRVLEPIELDKWYHVAAGHRGGVTPSLANDFIYINGTQVTPQITQTAEPFTLAGSKLTLGSEHNGTTEFLNGSIANFRLFNRALTSDEIYQLYAYQKEDFGHGDLSMTLKAGRLGIGTSEPRAMLDVRGILKASVGLFSDKPAFMVKNNDTVSVNTETTFTTHFNDVYTNVGGHYNTDTGVFTAPYEGTYIFYFAGLHVDGTAAGKVGLTFLKNNTNVLLANSTSASSDAVGLAWNTVGSGTNDEDYVIAIWMGTLQNGDEIQARVSYINSVTSFFYGHNHGYFSGYLI